MAGNLREIDITKDELDRIGKALKNEEFRNLLVEYCEELNDPATKKQYEEEIILLEKERGIDVTFINPTSGYVIKTSVDGNKLAFINVCSNVNVEKSTSKYTSQDGSRGHQWSLPHLLSPPRDDINNSGTKCIVYDVIFHPETLELASQSPQFRDMVNKISCEAVESNFSIKLDKANLKFPKLKYKGVCRPVVIRKKSRDMKHSNDSDVDKLYADMYKQIDKHYDNSKYKVSQHSKKQITPEKPGEYATPMYTIKHRSDMDIQDFTYDPTSKLNAAIPKELIIEINLPLLKSSADVVVDVTEKSISLISEKPSKYKLDLVLPYAVNEDLGNAKFDVDKRKLVLTLPVKRINNLLLSDIGRYDSGVDSDSSPSTCSPSDKSMPLIEDLQLSDSVVESQCSSLQSESDVFRTSEKSTDFLNADLHYSFPEYSCHLFDNILSFTINVKNVDPNSIEKQFSANGTAVHVKFSSISSGYFPINYAFYVRLSSHNIHMDEISIEVWDNNVIVQIPYNPCNNPLTSYYVGTSQDTSEEKLIDEPSVINNKQIEVIPEETEISSIPKIQVQLNSDDEIAIVVQSESSAKNDECDSSDSSFKLRTERKTSSNAKNILKSRSFSESSGDELSTSQSPAKGKSILKSNRSRFTVSRSVSESSIDDYTWSSFENCGATSESLIPEETEISSSMKKTVRFNDVVSKQLFR